MPISFSSCSIDCTSSASAARGCRGKPFRFKGKLFSLGGSLIDLSMKIFPWADIAPKKAAFKLHVGLDHDGLVPAFAEVTEGLVSKMSVVDTFKFPPGSVLVFDRGYSRCTWHKRLSDKGFFWVTRSKTGMRFEVARERAVSENSAVISDKIIRLSSAEARRANLDPIRRVEYRDPRDRQALRVHHQPDVLVGPDGRRYLQVPVGG